MSRADGELRKAVGRRGSFVRTIQAVAWSFFGVRKGSDHEHDVRHLNPLHVVIAGVLMAALFVGGLIALVSWVTASGVAG